MLAAPEPRPAQLKTDRSGGAVERAVESPLASLLDAAVPVQRLRHIGALLNAGHRAAPAQRPAIGDGVAVVQRLADGGQQITPDIVTAQNDLATLQRWKALADADWEEGEIGDLIAARIGMLHAAAAGQQQQAAAAAAQQQAAALAQQQAAAALAVQQAAQAEMAAENVPAAAFDYPTYQTLTARNLRRDQKAAFFIAGGANAAAVCAAIVAAGQSDIARKKALIAFADGASQAIATRIAGVFDTVMGWRMNNIDIALLGELVDEGVIGFHKNTYRDDAIEGGAIYVFSFVHLHERVQSEWHVHIGAHDVIKSGSWKSGGARFAHGGGARVETDAATNRQLLAIVA